MLQLIAGQRKVLHIGSVPHEVAAKIDCLPGIVHLGWKEARHIFDSHDDINGEDMMLLTFAVEKGQYYRDPKRPECLSVVYYSCITGRPYILALKRVGPGELWISTYHHTNPKKVKQRQAKWPLLSRHR
ncbi:hypothetical protein [Methylorubrum aminovorans]|uniref:hypothetical protein n=1 Tax=Methylorubrum aminovorans TaxID=269069 RepID=UPI003C2D3B64